MPDARGRALRALANFIVTDRSLGATLTEISEIAVSAIGPACMAGIAMHDEHGKHGTRVFTAPEAVVIDDVQYETGRGPCLDAWRTGIPVHLDDLSDLGAAEGLYDEFVAGARAYGIASTLSVPMLADGRTIGALNLYARQAHGFDAEATALAIDLAVAGAVVMVNAAAYEGAHELSLQLTHAMETRAVIEQAKGVLIGSRRGTTPDEAFALLVAASQRENVKLRDIATRIVSGEVWSEPVPD
ncbi:GAF and ANTAR domain-containing protein [soil metagenome]